MAVFLVMGSLGASFAGAGTVRGGAGYVGPGGRIGTLRVDRSSRADVIAFAGVPDVDRIDSFQVPQVYPNFEALGYACQHRTGPGLGPVTYYHGPYCRTVFYLNRHTGMLAALFTSSSRYSGPYSIRPGMQARQVEQRTHMGANVGCHTGFSFGRRHSTAFLLADVIGGRVVNHQLPNGTTALTLAGGHVAYFELDSTRHPVGLEFC